MKHAIYTTLKVIKDQLQDYLNSDAFSFDNVSQNNDGESFSPAITTVPDNVLLGNVALIGAGVEGIVMTLLKIEEENAAKQYPVFEKNGNKVKYLQPPIHLNLYTVFSAVYKNGNENFDTKYEDGLKQISNVIQFFNYKRYFTQQDAGGLDFNMKVSAKLISPSYDDLNKIWSVLGGKLFTFVLYKFHVVTMSADEATSTGNVIESIVIDTP